ncbi:hypothetical protein SAMD00019534_031490, partial [Acytostelium subglobosum LB1]|uniref:hypothetical protein n=1 Tax=Acytostelium subglobosum LB1 TaxID=1410327 RepID=UPI0006449CAD
MSMLTSLQQSIHKAYVKTVEKVTPTLATSKFLDEGVLTPEEFVQAGDLLAHKCPTWTWESGDPSRNVAYLPKDKQFLLTRNVPCYSRVRSLENESKASKSDIFTIEGAGDNEEWVAPHSGPVSEAIEQEVLQKDMSALKIQPAAPKPQQQQQQQDDDEDEDEDGDIPDIHTVVVVAVAVAIAITYTSNRPLLLPLHLHLHLHSSLLSFSYSILSSLYPYTLSINRRRQQQHEWTHYQQHSYLY